MFCAASVLGISLQHLNHPNVLVCCFLDVMCVFPPDVIPPEPGRAA